MSDANVAGHAYVIGWEGVAGPCPAEWTTLVMHSRPYTDQPVYEWLGEVARAIRDDDWEEEADGEAITQAVKALCEAFTAKTNLRLKLCYQDSQEGGSDDGVEHHTGYFDVNEDDWKILSPAAEQFKADYPAARVHFEKWVCHG